MSSANPLPGPCPHCNVPFPFHGPECRINTRERRSARIARWRATGRLAAVAILTGGIWASGTWFADDLLRAGNDQMNPYFAGGWAAAWVYFLCKRGWV